MSDDELLHVLHALRLVGFSDTNRLAVRLRSTPSDIESALQRAETSLLVTYRSGRMTGWSLTVVGRSHGESLLASEVARLGAIETVTDGYRRFRALNQPFLDLCTDWQLRPGAGGELVVNDHDDDAYDATVVARLGTLDEEIQPIVADLAAAVGRFGNYGPRLAAARASVESGERDWFTCPVIDSYHTVWFELHEDLLATLGLERSHEHRS